MSTWKNYLAKAVNSLDNRVDKVRYRLSERFGQDTLVVLAYLSYGTREKLFIKGRVLEAKSIQAAREDASLWENLKNAYKRFESDEVPHATLLVKFQDNQKELIADDEGYFETWLELSQPLSKDAAYVQEVELELLQPQRKEQLDTKFSGKLILPSQSADFGVISDMDDTVLQTGATSLISMARKTLLGNARTRLPFEGVAAFYEALHNSKNPLFYVSSSPWNLYDVLLEFLDINEIPAGPLLLRDWGISAQEIFPTSHGTHKLKVIKQILDTYPELAFILIGDSGQEDPEIYRDVVKDYPGRILAIYIRDVSKNASREKAIKDLAEHVKQAKSELILVPDTVRAAKHAAAKGWIAKEAVYKVTKAKKEEKTRPPV